MNNTKTGTILVLAVASLLTAACDPFPKAPGGAPGVLRAVSTGGSIGGNIEQSADNPNPASVVVNDATGDATFFVWFTKEMDGSSIQALPDTDTSGADPCDMAASPLTNSGNFPAGSQICYNAGSAQGGGIMSIVPADYLDVGTYSVSGTAKDYQGNPLAFSATFNVTHKPWLVPSDGYTIDVGWTNDAAATGFTIERTADANAAGDAPSDTAVWTEVATARQWAVPGSVGNNAIFRNAGLVPGTTYFYRITPEGVAGAVASSVKAGTSLARPSIKTSVNPTLPDGTVTTGTVQIAMARIRSAKYRVQFTTVLDAPAETDWVDANPANMLTTLGAALTNPISARSTNPFLFNVSGLAAGTYLARIVPEWTGVVGTPDGAGTPTNSSQFTIP